MTDPMQLAGRLILLSGGAGAIGQVIADTLVRHGAEVVIADLAEPAGSMPFHRVDLTDPGSVERLFDAVAAGQGRLPDVVCCHAGLVESGPVHQLPVDAFDRVLTTNTRSAYLLARSAAQRWIAAGVRGQLIFTTSWVQDVPWPGIAPYIASKAAIKALMRSFARELAPHGIRANAIAPGIVGVGMARRQWDTEPDYRARARRAIPLGEPQSPQSVADGFLFLASGLSAYMTGSTLLVDGGASLYPMDADTSEAD